MSTVLNQKESRDAEKVITKFKVWNYEDEVRAKIGIIKESEIRTYEGDGLVDTGATLLVLPEEIVEALGLSIARTATVTYANGTKDKKKITRGVIVEIQGRQATIECIVENRGTQPLIGQVPLEVMDLNPDLKTGTLKPRPGYEDAPLIELY